MALTADAVNLAGALVKMAGLFEREATGWADYPRVAAQCRRAIDQLTDEARYVIRTQDLVHGEGWLSAAGLTITHLQFTRLFRDGMAWERVLDGRT